VNGEDVTIRSLSRAEALHLQSFQGREADAEPFIVSKGASVSEDEAQKWLNSTDTETAGVLIDAILDLSGLTNAAPKAGKTMRPMKAVKPS
jgi:hypothetical protein